jgi:hypothetical protein
LSETSGAVSGSNVAAYLRGDAETAPVKDKILERLAAPAAPKPVAPAAPSTPAVQIDEAKLKDLAKPAETRPAAPAPAPAPPADLGKANEKLSSLLGKKDEQK